MEPPDPMVTRENSPWYIYYGYQAVAILFLFFWVLYMALIRPFMYIEQYLVSVLRWSGHRKLQEPTILSLINAYSDRISDATLKAFVAEQGEFDTYRFAIRPAYHPAKVILVVATGYDKVVVTSTKP